MLHVQSCYKNSRIFFEFVAVVHVFMCGGPLRYENYRVTVNEVSTLVQESFFVLFNRFSLDIVVAVAVVGARISKSRTQFERSFSRRTFFLSFRARLQDLIT